MPELPEVEVLVRYLGPSLQGRVIQSVQIHRAKVIAPHSPRQFKRTLAGARFEKLERQGKYLVFNLRPPAPRKPFRLIGHLGMTGRMYLQARNQPLPKHAAVVLELAKARFVYEDTRYFGRLSLDPSALERLGPEPLAAAFKPKPFAANLKRSAQPIKVKLLDQSLVAGIGNIYASEALYRAGIAPRIPSHHLNAEQAHRLWRAIRQVLREAIRFGSTVPLDWTGHHRQDGLFYYGRPHGTVDYYEERLRVYDRAGQPCKQCGHSIRQIVQAARSTYYCPRCQRS